MLDGSYSMFLVQIASVLSKEEIVLVQYVVSVTVVVLEDVN